MTARVARSGRSGPASLSQERHGFPRTEDCLSDTYLSPTCWKQWRELKIDGRAVHMLTVEQCQAVFAREDFSFLSDDHKAAVSEQLSREQRFRKQKRQQARKLDRGVLFICAVFLAPIGLPLGALSMQLILDSQITEVR